MVDKRDWVIETLRVLDHVGPWPGRFRAHKTLFLVDAFGLADQPFEFELYQYGPYSFDLDATFAELEASGDISSSYPLANYGARYKVKDDAKCEDVDERARRSIDLIAKHLASWSTTDVELAATCVFAMKRLGVVDDDGVVEMVKKIKPKHKDGDQVRKALDKIRDIERQLQRTD